MKYLFVLLLLFCACSKEQTPDVAVSFTKLCVNDKVQINATAECQYYGTVRFIWVIANTAVSTDQTVKIGINKLVFNYDLNCNYNIKLLSATYQ